MDIAYLGSTSENGCTFCLEKPLCLSNVASEKKKGFVSVLKILCHKRRKYDYVRTQKVEKTGKTQEDAHQLAVLDLCTLGWGPHAFGGHNGND